MVMATAPFEPQFGSWCEREKLGTAVRSQQAIGARQQGERRRQFRIQNRLSRVWSTDHDNLRVTSNEKESRSQKAAKVVRFEPYEC
jgi:hypothetical protein